MMLFKAYTSLSTQMEYDEFGLSKVSSGTPIPLYFSEEQNFFVIIEGMSSKYHTCSFEEDAIKAVLKYR